MENKYDVRERLFKVISDFSESQMEKPLQSLEQWENGTNTPDKREHLRKDTSVYGIFETIDSQFRASTKNVSMGGILIDPEIHLSFHDHISMTFFHRKLNIPIRSNGKVVRVDSDGVGIQFDRVIPVMSSL